ncbi:alpha/beta-hydrolase [Cytidiella melzeri]|nr:alpha/beta-hydrolase [Cytidiella melzeri]
MTKALSFTYKVVDKAAMQLDLYLPDVTTELGTDAASSPTLLPIVLNFHGGGLTVGNTRSWFPTWLKDRVVAAGFAFLSAEYRLIPPSTGHDIIEDIRDLFTFVAKSLNSQLLSTHPNIQIDVNSTAVSGCSAGGLCAYLAAMHAHPKPKAVVALYAMGGQLLTPQYLQPKSAVFLRGRELLDPEAYSDYLYPRCLELEPTSRSALAYHGADAPIPGFPANPRMLLNRLYLQLGNYLDYYTGVHEPSLSQTLRQAVEAVEGEAQSDYPADRLKALIPAQHLPLFPQFSVDSSWPPVFLAHGSRDSAVWMKESESMHGLLCEAGITTVFRIIDGAEHSLDYVANAEDLYGKPGGLFDDVCQFLVNHLRSV